MRVRYAAKTDVGRKREHNEDHFAVVDDDQLFVVADGMGGHASGEVASKMAADTIRDFFEHTRSGDETTWPFKLDCSLSDVENRLACSLKYANRRIFEASTRDDGCRGMGTTVVALVVSKEEVTIAHVGDSRVYRIRDNEIERLTRDHSLWEDYKEAHPDCSEQDEDEFAYKNVITRALGMGASVDIAMVTDRVVAGDVFLLCTDGLTNMLRDQDLLRIVSKASTLKRGVAQLVLAANRNGGTDNITAILLRLIHD